ncbi:MAG: MOSC domain-containing protein [Gemmatimonadetes bacterium]|nr:MOSC domain-containing protein [Gemmatimonadota bacterium]
MSGPSRVDSNSIGNPQLYLSDNHFEVILRTLGAPKDSGRLTLLVRRTIGGVRETPETAQLSRMEGLVGDSWGRQWKASPDGQLTVMETGVAQMIANGQPLTLFGDQLFVDLDLSVANLPIGSRIQIGGATVEVSAKPHNGCGKFRARFGADALRLLSRPDLRQRNFRGIYMRVVDDGAVAMGDDVRIISRG